MEKGCMTDSDKEDEMSKFGIWRQLRCPAESIRAHLYISRYREDATTVSELLQTHSILNSENQTKYVPIPWP